jgi:hypothetical protein
MAALMQSGKSADSPEAMAIAEEHRQHISHWFYPCPAKMHTGLAAMYTSDPRFAQHYDSRASGLAQYMSDAIYANARRVE